MIQERIKQYLQSQSDLAALVGNRIYPNYLPENATYPAISYFRVSNIRPRVKDGHIGEAQPRFQFDIWAEKYAQAAEVERLLVSALDNIDFNADIYHSEYVGGSESYEQTVKLHHFMVDYLILYRE